MPVPEENPVHEQLEQDWTAQNDNDPTTVPTEETNPLDEKQQQEKEKREDTFNADLPEYDTNLEVPEKSNLEEVLNGIAAPLQQYGNGIGVQAGGGQCSFNIPISLGGASSSGTLDFCRFANELAAIGTMLVGLAYVWAAVIVIRA